MSTQDLYGVNTTSSTVNQAVTEAWDFLQQNVRCQNPYLTYSSYNTCHYAGLLLDYTNKANLYKINIKTDTMQNIGSVLCMYGGFRVCGLRVMEHTVVCYGTPIVVVPVLALVICLLVLNIKSPEQLVT